MRIKRLLSGPSCFKNRSLRKYVEANLESIMHTVAPQEFRLKFQTMNRRLNESKRRG